MKKLESFRKLVSARRKIISNLAEKYQVSEADVELRLEMEINRTFFRISNALSPNIRCELDFGFSLMKLKFKEFEENIEGSSNKWGQEISLYVGSNAPMIVLDIWPILLYEFSERTRIFIYKSDYDEYVPDEFISNPVVLYIGRNIINKEKFFRTYRSFHVSEVLNRKCINTEINSENWLKESFEKYLRYDHSTSIRAKLAMIRLSEERISEIGDSTINENLKLNKIPDLKLNEVLVYEYFLSDEINSKETEEPYSRQQKGNWHLYGSFQKWEPEYDYENQDEDMEYWANEMRKDSFNIDEAFDGDPSAIWNID